MKPSSSYQTPHPQLFQHYEEVKGIKYGSRCITSLAGPFVKVTWKVGILLLLLPLLLRLLPLVATSMTDR